MGQSRVLRIVIPGGTGVTGSLLARHFSRQGHAVTVFGRYPKAREWTTVHWEPPAIGPWIDALEDADVIINLAGRSLNCRHTAAHRREILESRLQTTALLGQAIAHCTQAPRLWLNLETVDIFGGAPQFSAQVAARWEQQFWDAETPRTRKLALRCGHVMSPDAGGIFVWLLRLMRFALVGRFASGNQIVCWIHDLDFIRAIEFLSSREDWQGMVEVCSPHSLSNAELMAELRHAWNPWKLGVPIPRWLLETGAFLLRTETSLVLESRFVVPGRLLAAGFEFQFPDWPLAAADLVRRFRNEHS